MFRPVRWDVSRRTFILAADYREGRGGSVPLSHVAPRCFTCGRVRPHASHAFLSTGSARVDPPWRAVVLPTDPDGRELRWLTAQGAFRVVPICPVCEKRGTVPIDFSEWDRLLQANAEAVEYPDAEAEVTRAGFGRPITGGRDGDRDGDPSGGSDSGEA